MKKTFEDWLVISDVDGTLHNKMHNVPQRNVNAIRKFTELGGNFTLASGRTVSCLAPAYHSVACNQPAVVLNGAGIYDIRAKHLLYSSPIGRKGMEFAMQATRRFSGRVYSLDAAIFCADMVYIVKNGLLSQSTMFVDPSPYMIVDPERLPRSGWLKVIFFGMPQTIHYFQKYAASIENPDVHFMVSSPVTIEMLQKDTNKGVAVMQLANRLGIRRDHVAAIGDYYNDWDMLRTVGLPACAGQAPKKVQSICKFHACHCNHGCVADLLEFIMYRNGGLPE